MGNNDGHGPARAIYRIKEHVMYLALKFEGRIAGMAGEHGAVDGIEGGRITAAGRQVVHRMTHHQCLCGAHHDLPGAAHHHAEGRRVHLHAPHQLREPVKGDIGRKHGGHTAFLVPYGDGVGGHEHVAAALVKIRLRPVTATQFQRLHKPFLVLVVVFFRCQGGCKDFPFLLIRIRGQVLLYQGHRGATDNRIAPYQAHGNGRQTVRAVHLLLYAPDAVTHRRFHLVHHVGNVQFGCGQLALCPARCFFRENMPGVEIL